MKICSTCNLQKPLEDFAKRQDCKDGHAGQCKKCHTLKIYEWRKANKDKVNAIKRKYYSSEKGKSQKRKEEQNYVASGGRMFAEKRRSERPISSARVMAKLKYATRKRVIGIEMSEFDVFVLEEAISLAKLRSKISNFSWHVDHIIPISRGGTNHFSNLQVVPGRWNQSKGTKHTKFFNQIGGHDA